MSSYRGSWSILGCLAFLLFAVVLAARLAWEIAGAMVGVMAGWVA